MKIDVIEANKAYDANDVFQNTSSAQSYQLPLKQTLQMSSDPKPDVNKKPE